MKILFTILYFLVLSGFTSQNHTKIVGAPINVAASLVKDSTIEQMAETCRYYHLEEAESEDDFIVFTHNDGTKLRFKVVETEDGTSPLIEVITYEKHKKIEIVLQEMGFKKKSK